MEIAFLLLLGLVQSQSWLLAAHLPLCWPKGLQLIHPLRKHQLLRSLWTPSFNHIPENKAWSHCLVQQVLQRFVQQLALTWCCLGREMMLSSDFSRENVIQSLSLPQQLAVWL